MGKPLFRGDTKMKPYVICGGKSGKAVVFGWLDTEPIVGEPAKIHRARMVLYWPRECVGLFGLAKNGPREGLRLTAVVAEVADTVRQFITVSEEAAEKLDEWPEG
jgi:hypothetical protein